MTTREAGTFPDTIRIEFGEFGNLPTFETDGFSYGEPGGRWTIGQSSFIKIPKVVLGQTDYRLRMRVLPCLILGHVHSQSLSVYIENTLIYSGRLKEWSELEVPVSATLIADVASLVITLRHPDAVRPAELTASSDGRALGLFIVWMTLSRTEETSVALSLKPAWEQSVLAQPRSFRRLRLVFNDDAIVADGVPVNFKGVASYIQTSPLVKYTEFSEARRHFEHCRISDLGSKPGVLVIGLFASPHSWLGRDGSEPLASKISGLQKVLDQHNNLKLLLDYSWEFGTGSDFWTSMDTLVRDLAVDPVRVAVLVANSGAASRYSRHLKTLQREPGSCYTVIGLDMFMMYAAVEFSRKRWFGTADSLVSDSAVECAAKTLRSHKLLSLNRRPRWHRFMLSLMVTRLSLRESSIMSMPSSSYKGDWSSEDHLVQRYGALMDRGIWQELQSTQELMYSTLPWIIDRNMDESGHTSLYAFNTLDRNLYMDSYINVVTESYMDCELDDVVLSEKTCKAIAGLQPFIVFGSPRLFDVLDILGFQRPRDLDLTYDQHNNVPDRLNGLFKTLDQLQKYSRADIHEIYYVNQEVTSMNRERLFEMPSVLGAAVASELARLA